MEDLQKGTTVYKLIDMRTEEERKKGSFNKKGCQQANIGIEKVYAKHK